MFGPSQYIDFAMIIDGRRRGMPMTETKLHALDGEDLLTIPAASRVLPAARGCGRANPATLWRWCTVGVRVYGKRVQLEHVRIGAYLYTSTQALARFLEALNTPPAARPKPSPEFRTPGQRQRAKKLAARRAARVEK